MGTVVQKVIFSGKEVAEATALRRADNAANHPGVTVKQTGPKQEVKPASP